MDRAALKMAVRRVAYAEGTAATRDALEHLEHTAAAWRESLIEPGEAKRTDGSLSSSLRRVFA